MSEHKLYLRNLDSIRFFAALIVYIGHGIAPSYQYLSINNTVWEQLLNVISIGPIGVYMFFVLSGFLITYLLISEQEINNKISLKNFYIRRILRIWPLYFMIILFAFGIIPFVNYLTGTYKPAPSKIIYYLTFLSNYDVISLFRNNLGFINPLTQNITWSVSVEEQFYLFWPLLFVFLPKRFWFHSILLVIAGSLLFRFLYFEDAQILYLHTIALLVYLGMGALFAYLIKTNKRIKHIFENTSTFTHFVLFAIAFCFLCWFKQLFTFKYGIIVGSIAISLSFALIISAQALTTRKSILNLQNISFANKWGKYTYGIYLIHPIVLAFMSMLVPLMPFPTENFTYSFTNGIVCFIITLLLSKLSYKYYESRFLSLKKKFTTVETYI